VVQFTQLTLLSPPSPSATKSKRKKHPSTNRQTHPSTPRTKKKPKIAAHYLAFDDDYFWELIRKDYTSAWRYVDRMNRF
jgi:hypothetical protein